MNNLEFKFGELFCGPGGIAKGADEASVPGAKIKHLWASDYDEAACKTYRRNIFNGNNEAVICTDVSELKIESLPPIDAFAFGFPCNDFSLIGKRHGVAGKYGPLYTYGVKVLRFQA